MKLPAGHVPGLGVYKATAYGGLGEKLLKQLGWKEGEGLGVEGQGMTSAIKVHKKEDTIGVGGRQRNREVGKDWWEKAYNSAAQTIQTGTASSSSDDSDAEEKQETCVTYNRDGTVASGTQEELQLARQLAKDPWGRFGGRNGKLARIRRQEATAAAALTGAVLDDIPNAVNSAEMLHLTVAKRAMTCQTQASALGVSKELSREKNGGKPGIQAESVKAKQKDEPEKPPKKRRKVSGSQPDSISAAPKVIEVSIEGETRAPFIATPLAGWWGASQFVSRGCLEGLEDGKSGGNKQRQSFDEDTQADLFNLTHKGKVSGKQGLGVGKGKGVGHDWKGSRIVFEEAEASEATHKSRGSVPLAAEPAKEACAPPTAAGLPPLKWKKLCKDVLTQESAARMKLSKLVKRVSSALPQEQRPADLQRVILKKIGKSSSIVLEGKYIRLASST